MRKFPTSFWKIRPLKEAVKNNLGNRIQEFLSYFHVKGKRIKICEMSALIAAAH